MSDPRDVDAGRLAARSLDRGDVTGWFEDLYAEAADGSAVVPWDAPEPNPTIVEALADRPITPRASALVVGCGLGRDAEYVASLGYRTTAFDVSPTAIAGARGRFPDSVVDYWVANLLDLPSDWSRAFDLVVESITVQSMPVTVRREAIAAICAAVAAGGELLVVSGIREEGVDVDGPPWPLTPSEIESFADDGLVTVSIDQPGHRWLAWFRRPA